MLVISWCSIFCLSLLSKNIKIKIYWTVILIVALYGCETWLLTLTEEHRLRVFENRVLRVFENRVLRVFENRVLRRIFGPKRGEVTGEWRKLHNEELNDLYSSPNIIWVIRSKRMRWVRHVACVGKGEVHTGFWWGHLRERDHL